MADASPSLPQAEEPDSQPQLQSEAAVVNPNSIECDRTQNQPEEISHPQSPQTLTVEAPEQSEVDHAENPVQEDPLVLDQEEHKLDGNRDPQSGASTVSAPTLVPPIADAVEGAQTPMVSPTVPHRRLNKRKTGGSKKKLEAIEKRVRTLTENLNPIPFVPSETKTLYFAKHERVLKRLGLWDFVHVEFDRSIRVDLLAQLIGCYDPKMRASYVNEVRIRVNRTDLGRALKLPVKKEKGNASVVSAEAVDLVLETLSEESITFIEDFMSNWVLLHGDPWMMPSEVLNWTKAIKDGHPEKVDWAGLIWFMVEKELVQRQQLRDCYYASHLQCLVKSQREDLLMEEPKVEPEIEVEGKEPELEVEGKEPEVEVEEKVPDVEVEGKEPELEVEGKEPEVEVEEKEFEDDGEVKMGEAGEFQGQEPHDNVEVEGPNVELTLGQEIVEKEEVKDGDTMAVEENKDEEQGNWLLDGKNDTGDHFLQRCNMEEDTDTDGGDEERIQEEMEDGEEEEADGDGYDLTPKDHIMASEGLTGNLGQGMETNQVAFSYPEQLYDQSGMELLASRAETHMSAPHMSPRGAVIYGSSSKRDMDYEHDISHDSLNGSNKRLRSEGPWDHKSSDFEMCVEQVQHWMGKARMMYNATEQACETTSMNHQFLLSELQRRDQMIELLDKTKYEELQKKEGEINRLERELFMMGNLLEGYRKGLKETQRAFLEYRQSCQFPEEPLYKDVGAGGLVLSTMELEKQRLKQEEEDRLTRLMIEQKIKEFEGDFIGKFEARFSEVQKLEKQLMDFENEMKLLKELSAKRKGLGTSECASNE